jgi:hypothetical protein
MKKLISLVSSVSLLALFASCGGGGDGPATATATTATATTTTVLAAGDASRYVGTWSACLSTGTSGSQKETTVITATGASSLAFTDTDINFPAAGCAGTASTPSTSTGTVVFNGTTKTVGTSTVDKGTVTQGTSVQKQIFLVTATTLSSGKSVADGGTLDVDGYPNSLDSGVQTQQ